MRLFGLLVDADQVVAVGPMEEVDYGPEPDEFYVLTASGNDVVIHQGSASLSFIAIPVPSVN